MTSRSAPGNPQDGICFCTMFVTIELKHVNQMLRFMLLRFMLGVYTNAEVRAICLSAKLILSFWSKCIALCERIG